MTGVIRKLALPGLLTSAAAWSFHWALALGHIRPEVLWLIGGQLHLWWWCLLPICGALAIAADSNCWRAYGERGLSERYGQRHAQQQFREAVGQS